MTEKIELTLNIEGQEYKAPAPRMKLLKQVMRFNVDYQSERIDLNTPSGVDALFSLVVDIVGNPDVTVEKLEEMEILEFSETFSLQNINDWLNQFFPQKKVVEASQVATMKESQKAQKSS